MKFNVIFAFIISCIIIASCDDKDMPNDKPYEDPVTGECLDSAMISSRYVAIDWENTRLIDYDQDNGIVTMSATNQSKALKDGSIFVLDVDTLSQVLIVAEAETTTEEVRLKTYPGDISNIFANTELHLTTDETTEARSANTYYPTSIEFIDETGNRIEIPYSRYDKDKETRLTGKLWKWDKGNENLNIYKNGTNSIQIIGLNENVNIDLDITMNFGGRTRLQWLNNGIKTWKSELLNISTKLIGTASINCALSASFSSDFKDNSNEELVLHRNIFKPCRVKFTINGVPVWITLKADLMGYHQLEAEGSLNASIPFSFGVQGEFGINYDQANNRFSLIKCAKPIIKENELKINGKATFDTEINIYPRIKIQLYDTFTSRIDIVPYMGFHTEAGFGTSVDENINGYAAWCMRLFGGLKMGIATGLDFIGEKDAYIESNKVKILEKNIYKTPNEIKRGQFPPQAIWPGTTGMVEFKVYDEVIGKSQLTSLPHLVFYETDGEVLEPISVCQDGKSTVQWTPASLDDRLRAIIYDANGDIISEAIINCFGSDKTPSVPSFDVNNDPLITRFCIIPHQNAHSKCATVEVVTEVKEPTDTNDLNDWEITLTVPEYEYNELSGRFLFSNTYRANSPQCTPLGDGRYIINDKIQLHYSNTIHNCFKLYADGNGSAIIMIKSAIYRVAESVENDWIYGLYNYKKSPKIKIQKVVVNDDRKSLTIIYKVDGALWMERAFLSDTTSIYQPTGSVSDGINKTLIGDFSYPFPKALIFGYVDVDQNPVYDICENQINLSWTLRGNEYIIDNAWISKYK